MKNLKNLLLCFIIISSMESTKAAEKIAFVNGSLSRTILVENLEKFTKTGKLEGKLSNILKMSGQNPKEISDLLNQKIELSITVTSKLMNSKIGIVILKRIAKIIYPLRVKQTKVSVPAIRASVIKGLAEGKGTITLIDFIKYYPNKIMTINVPELSKILSKVESINDLVDFLSDSPLDGLKESKPKDLDLSVTHTS